ncbi:MAG: uridine kinase [Clostridia bacterium]|nr:uridine kinase [Clostridia bacterium]
MAGGSGSGKSTFAKKILDCFKNDCTLINCDDYYYPHDDISYEERCKINYDAPEAMDLDLVAEHIADLKDGKTIICPTYDFANHTRAKETKKVAPSKIVVVDGILTFYNEKLRNLFDLKIYVDSDADERVLRRAKRDTEERGRTFESVMEQYITTVKPMHEKYVEPTKKLADIIVNGGMNEAAFMLIKAKIESVLCEKEM